MGGQTASWFLLIGLITFAFSNAKSFDEELFLVVENLMNNQLYMAFRHDQELTSYYLHY